jgi:hypothetical protein
MLDVKFVAFYVWYRVVFEVDNSVSDVHAAFIFRVEMVDIQVWNDVVSQLRSYYLYEDNYFSRKLERRRGSCKFKCMIV